MDLSILRLFSLANKIFSKPIEPFFDTGISKEEFSLILAIIFLNPGILIRILIKNNLKNYFLKKISQNCQNQREIFFQRNFLIIQKCYLIIYTINWV